MTTINSFAKFGKRKDVPKISATGTKTAVIYTRVSSKEQYDTNLSLDFQKKAIEEYAKRTGTTIVASFGGIYESAKTDGRKEFNRMLDYIKQKKGRVNQVLIYTLCRFSRTGGGAIKLAEDLREKYGVEVFAVTQPADTSLPSGELQQNIQFIFAKYDNQLRKQRAVAGTKEKLEKGIWCVKPPMGYDILRANGERKIVVNALGKKLRKAFIWKAEGMKSEEIISRLQAMGVKIYKQKMSLIFSNPFYCGILTHKMLDGKVLEGTHEKLISKEIFLKVNNVRESFGGYGVAHKNERDEVPLKVFIKCDECGQPFSGYVVKKKRLWYYKCRTKGCKCNVSAKEIHKLFTEELAKYNVKEDLIPAILLQLSLDHKHDNQDTDKQKQVINEQLREVNKKLENIEEKYYVLNEMSRETFQKFYSKYKDEEEKISRELAKYDGDISNHEIAFEKALKIATELAPEWASAGIKRKENLQKLFFPDGIVFDRKKRAFRTLRVNAIFENISRIARVLEDKKNGQEGNSTNLSSFVGTTGFEPATT